ncbi:MAG: hypothetical protein ER33_04800 [Cyanobium sp. CACIAM 14]|nr:MAG: hypothetical protein ER33_04800 [Cyanobium sp. CACIAM 14]
MQFPGLPAKPGGSTALVLRLRDFVRAGDPWVQLRVLLLLAIGWLLSPLCWWNDLVINLPLAYGVGLLAKQLRPEWFAGGLIAGYWLSNVVGIVLMQTSALEVFQESGTTPSPKRELLWGLISSSVYTLVVFALVQVGVIHTPIPELTATAGG